MTATATALVSIRDLRKAFARNSVLRGVDLDIARGEFVGLMGPNGAGKSTLIKILDGVYTADSGGLSYGGAVVRSLSALPSVGFVHQDLGIVDDLTVVENLRLGMPATARQFGPLLNLREERRVAREALAPVGLEVSLDALARELSPGEKALLAVARLLSTGAEFLIVDEATSTLPAADAQRFIAALRGLTEQGTTVVYVSHKLSEVRNACSRVVLLIDGVIAADEQVDAGDDGQLARLLGSHEQSAARAVVTAAPRSPGEVVFELADAHTGTLGPLDFAVRAGEVVGLTGLVGSGLYEIAYLASGRATARSGRVRLTGEAALVAPQRETEGSVGEMSVGENLTLSAMRSWRRHGLLDLGAERKVVADSVRSLNVVPPLPDIALSTLSGGNQQKVMFGRALLTGAGFYVLCEPSRGVDIATRQALYDLIISMRDAGAAILVVTSDSEDLFAVCDRVGVLQDGTVRGPWPRTELADEELALLL